MTKDSNTHSIKDSTIAGSGSGAVDSEIRPTDFSVGSDVVIRVENLWKEYRLGVINHGTLRADLSSWWARMRGKDDPNIKIDQSLTSPRPDNSIDSNPQERFWALKDVSFDVRRGEVLGIIGKNGAGKSTLLKILSKVTTPTRGQIRIRGRVASLLEVGTGFHPELTGRENIFLNGAILGMGRAEIRRKFDEIVAFSEVEKFIDTPVKRYSSGMYVRLAFAVAAHLEPEILLIDEVLAVGDVQFQKKCLGKMEEVSHEGRTILFVSHNMGAIRNLCRRAIWLHGGKIETEGQADQVVTEYLKYSQERAKISLEQRKDRKGSGEILFENVSLLDSSGKEVPVFTSGESAILVFHFQNREKRELKNVHLAIGIDDQTGQRITLLDSDVTGQNVSVDSKRNHQLEVVVDRLPLVPGRYSFTIYCTVNGTVADWIQNAGSFDVVSGPFFVTGRMPPPGQGNFLVDCSFRLSETKEKNDG